MAPRSIESIQPTGARYVDGDERAEYVDRPLVILAVHPEAKAKFGPRHVIDAAVIDTGEIIGLAFTDNPTRVTMWTTLIEGLAAEGKDAFAPVCLYLSDPASEGGNKFWAFRSATEAEIAEAGEEAKASDDGAGDEPEPKPEAKGKAAK